MKSKTEIAEMVRKAIAEDRQGLSKQYQNTQECQEFYDGDFMSYRDRIDRMYPAGRGRKKLPFVQFNKVKPYVNAVKGFFAQNRRKSSYVPRLDTDEKRQIYGDHANSIADYVRKNANADQKETQQDGDMLICGYGATDTALSYGDGYATTDPNGEIIIGRLDPLCVGWDSESRSPNLLDARRVWYKQEYDCEEAESLFNAEEEDFDPAMPLQGEGTYNPNDGIYTKIIEDLYDWSDRKRNRVNVYFYQWMEIENYWRADNPLMDITDPITAEYTIMRLKEIAALSDEESLFTMDPTAKILDVNAEQKTALLELFENQIKFSKFKRKKFYGAVCSGKKVFSAFPLLSQQGYTIKFKTGDFHASTGIWVGLVNSMKEPVLYYNKFLSTMMYTIAAGSKGGIITEKSAIENITKFERDWARTDGVAVVEDGALAGNRVQPKKEPYSPTGVENLLEIANASIPETVGIDRAFFGSSERAMETAALQRQRIKQTMTVLACYSDSILLYAQEHARLLLDQMRALVKGNPGFAFLSSDADGKQNLMFAEAEKLSAEFYVSIEDAPETGTEKEERAQILMGMGDKLLQVGDPSGKDLYAAAIKIMPLDMVTKSELITVLKPNQEAVDPAQFAQLQEQLKQLQSEQSRALVDNTNAQTALALAKVQETNANKQAKEATTIRTLAESDKVEIETDIARTSPRNAENISISV